MFDLSSKNSEQKMKLTYAALGISVVFSWRLPDTEEHIAYQTAKFRKEANHQIEFGLKILTAIQDGDFSIEGKPLSSNPESPDYRQDWKDALKGNSVAAKMISDLGYMVFDGSYSEPVNALPFPKS